MNCMQCGEYATHFCEGVCVPCYDQNQEILDHWNAEFDWWNSMTPKQQDDRISIELT